MIENRKYTNRDITSIRNEIISYIKTRTNLISDFSDSELMSIYIEVLAGSIDMLSYYLDNQALETFIMSARQPKNIRALLQTYNYKLKGIHSARGSVTINANYNDAPTIIGDVLIPRYTSISSDSIKSITEEIKYLTTKEVILSMEHPTAEVDVIQGVVHTKKLIWDNVGSDYRYYINDNNVVLDTVEINSNTKSWQQVKDVFTCIDGGKLFSVHLDEENKPYIMFSYDYKNYITEFDGDTNISYVKSMGTKGVVPAYHLNTIASSILDTQGRDIRKHLQCTNTSKTFGAIDTENLNLAKANALNYIRTMGKCIILEDFDAHIKANPYVLKAYTVDWRRDRSLVPQPFTVKSWIVTSEGSATNQVLLKEITDDLASKSVGGMHIEIVYAEYVNVDLELEVEIKGTEAYRQLIIDNIKDVLNNKLSIENTNYDDVISNSKISQWVLNVSNDILNVNVTMPQEVYRVSPKLFPIFNIKSVKGV